VVINLNIDSGAEDALVFKTAWNGNVAKMKVIPSQRLILLEQDTHTHSLPVLYLLSGLMPERRRSL